MTEIDTTNPITTFSPGKLILIGDHAVVHGAPGLVSSIDKGVTITTHSGNGQISDPDQSVVSFLQQQLDWLQAEWELSPDQLAEVSIDVSVEIPVRSGLGSSTALTTALFRALAKVVGKKVSDQELFELVVAAESEAYPVSGIDQAACVYEGTLEVQKKDGKYSWRRMASSIVNDQQFFLIQSGMAEEATAKMVHLFGQNVSQPGGQAKLDQMTQLSADFIAGVKQNSWQPEVLQTYGDLLIEMGVVGKTAAQMIAELKKAGATAKITAAGGLKSGSGIISAWHEHPEDLARFLEDQSWDYWTVSLGGRDV